MYNGANMMGRKTHHPLAIEGQERGADSGIDLYQRL